MAGGMIRKIRYLLLTVFAVCFCLAGCVSKKSQPSGTQAAAVEQESPVQIGFSFDSFVIERWTRDRDVFVSTAEDLGAEVNIQNANGDVEKQISQIEYLIQKKMDVIVIIAIDGDALIDVTLRAKEAGIRVVCYDRLICNAGCDLYVSFDNEMVGQLMGEALCNALPEGGDLFAIYGSQSDNNMNQVKQGFEEAIRDRGLNVIYSGYCSNWLAELAFDEVSAGLEQCGHVDGILCGNDDLASQAIRALSEHMMAGKVAVVAQDADLSACQRIVEGTQEMTVYKPVDELARQAAVLSVKLGGGGALEEVTETINDGKEEIPYYRIEPVAVTKDNMDGEIIDSGFHRREDVYLNVE